MLHEIKIPELGESVTEGVVGAWLHEDGETVAEGEPVMDGADDIDVIVAGEAYGDLGEIIRGLFFRDGQIAELEAPESLGKLPVSGHPLGLEE